MELINQTFKKYEIALQIEYPWYVEKESIDHQKMTLDLYLNFDRKGSFTCATCGTPNQPFHDLVLEERIWRHLDFWQYKTFLHMPMPRVKCNQCKKCRTAKVDWARPGAGLTYLFEYQVLLLIKEMPVNSAARIMREHDTRLWRVIRYYVNQALQNQDLSEVSKIGIDETSSKRGHQYIMLVLDLMERKVIYATPGKDAATLKRFKDRLEEKSGSAKQIKQVCSDLSPAFIKGVQTHFPSASHTFDKFHVMKLINEAVDDVRREEQKEQPQLKRSRYIWLKNESNLNEKQKETLNSLKDSNLKTARAYRMKLAFQDLWTKSATEAKSHLYHWYNWAIRSRLEPMKSVAQTVKKHTEGILNWFDSKISNGILEGTNSLIQAAKRKARGYRTTDNLIAMVYIIAGKLDLSVPEQKRLLPV